MHVYVSVCACVCVHVCACVCVVGVHVYMTFTAEIVWVDRWSLAQTIHCNIDTTYTNSCGSYQLEGRTTDSVFSLAEPKGLSPNRAENRFSEHMTV